MNGFKDFDGKIELDWILTSEKLPLQEEKYEGWNVVTDVLILVVNEENFNEDPGFVQIQFERTEARGRWIWMDGTPYPECHAKNIRYWCYPPNYLTKQLLEFESNCPKFIWNEEHGVNS
jgi:hypothetical protein